jgi:N-methylhydantoinase B
MSTDAIAWDGVTNSYIPPAQLRIPERVRLHTDAAAEVDPITYEVLRHALWNVNDEHGVTIDKVSGSPFAHDAHDYNTVILTEDGEYVFFGYHGQFFSGVMDLPIKWTLENLGGSPGIDEGDMFLSNDPWIGAVHQSDVQITCPVFWDGKIFCWVANSLHQYDMGGNTPGSFCADANDVFDEPTPIPPVKIVERGEIRGDLERMYLRHSRQPQLLALDLRAQIAGNSVARARIVSFIERYGPDTVKAVMRKIIDDSEQAFLRRIAQIPDGTWRHAEFLEAALPDDRELHRVAMSVEKRGDTLTFSNRGSDPQAGALNSVFAGWRAGVMTIINPFLCYDQLYAIGGALRRLRFDPEPGTINCPTFPASVTNSQIGNVISGAMANMVIGKMLLSAPELKRDVFAPCGSSIYPMSAIGGVDQWGNPFGTGFLDAMGGATGAFTFRDGVDTGGVSWQPASLMPNVEQAEQTFPILYLYRREVADSGGAGRFRSGNSAAFAIVPHGTEEIFHAPSAAGCVVPTGQGLAGGHPACTNNFRMRRDTDVLERFANREVPTQMDDLAGTEQSIGPKERGLVQHPTDVWEVRWTAGGGYGDPLLRDPEAVATDVRDGNTTAEAALNLYGVVLTEGESPSVDAAATDAERAERRERRLRDNEPWNASERVVSAAK